MHITLAEMAKIAGGEFTGDGSFVIKRLCSLEKPEADGVVYISDTGKKDLSAIKAGAFLLPQTAKDKVPAGINAVFVDNPEWGFTLVMRYYMSARLNYTPGIHKTAVIADGVKLGVNVSVGACSVIESGAEIGDGTVIYPQVYVGKNTKIGKNCQLHPQTVVREEVIIKDGVILESGARVGTDGFGFVTVKGVHEKIPQIGNVVLEDGVEIGANTTVDRAKIDTTHIGKGVKVDNLVQLGHNVKVGDGSIIIAQVGIAGSTELGKYVVLAGQAGIVGHIKIGDGAQVGAQAGVLGSLDAGGKYFGTPARPARETLKIYALEGKLPELFKEISEFKKQLSAKKPWWKFW